MFRYLRELNSVDKDIAYYMQGLPGRGSNPRHSASPYLKVWVLTTRLLDKKNPYVLPYR